MTTQIVLNFKELNKIAYMKNGEFYTMLNLVKNCQGRVFDNTKKLWTVNFTKANLEILKPYLDNYSYFESLTNSNESKLSEEKYKFLMPFQKESVAQLIDNKVLLCDEVGLGKTVTLLTFCEISTFKKVLVICPAPLKQNWQNELKKFFNIESLILEGNYNKRLEIFEDFQKRDLKYLIVNYEQLNKMNDFLFKLKWNVVLHDEVHRIKNYSTVSHKFAKKLNTDKRLGASATPLINNLREVHTIANFLTDNSFMSWKFFSENYVMWDEIYLPIYHMKKKIIGGYKNVDDFNLKLNKIMVRHQKKDVMTQLPEITYKNYYIELSGSEQRVNNIYQTKAKESFKLGDEKNLLSYFTLALEICDGVDLFNRSESENAIKVNSSENTKLKELKNILADMGLK